MELNKSDEIPKGENTLTFTRPLHLCEQVVILDGLTGTGKTMFSPLLSSLERMQNARFEYMVEFLCIAATSGKLSSDAASTLLNLLADSKCYDGVISREVNFRPRDLSSVFNSSRPLKYLRQLFMADGEAAANRLQQERPILLFVTHQLMTCMQTSIDAFEDRLRVVEMVRHPLYLLAHWDSYLGLYGTTPRDFTVWIDHAGQSLPWFTKGWEERYARATQFDKVIYSISALMGPVFDRAAAKDSQGRIAFIPFERFVLAPEPFLSDIESLLGVRSTPATKKVMRSQKLPRGSINDGPQKSIYKRYRAQRHDKRITHEADYERLLAYAKGSASDEAFQVLSKCMRQYEQTFGLWFSADMNG